MTSETYQDLIFDRKGQKRASRPKLLKLTDVSMPNRSRKKTKFKIKERSQSNVRDRIYDDPAYTDDISHLAIPLRRNSGPDKVETLPSMHKRKSGNKESQYFKRSETGSHRRDRSSSSDSMQNESIKHRRGQSLERANILDRSPKKREKRDRAAKQKRNLSLDNTLSNSLKRSIEKTESSLKTASIERLRSRQKPFHRQNASEGWSSCLAATSDSSKATENEEVYSGRKEPTKMQIGKRFLRGEIGIKSFNYYLLKEGLKSSKKFMDKQRNSLSKSDSKKSHAKSEENIYEEIFFVDKNSEPEDHVKYPDCELCVQQCTKEDCEYCMDEIDSRHHEYYSLGRNDRSGLIKHENLEPLPTGDELSTKGAHILQYQSYNPNNPGVYKIETTPVSFTSDYNPIHQLQQSSHHHQQQQPHHHQQPQQQHHQQSQHQRRNSKNGTVMGTGRINTKSSSSSDSLHHKYAKHRGSQDFYECPQPINYTSSTPQPVPRIGGEGGGYDQKIYKSDSRVSILSEYSIRSESSNRNFRCGEVSDSSLGDSMFSYSTQRRYFGSSESCRFAFECRRCSLDGEKCSFSDTCRYECRNCDCSSSYFSSDFDELNNSRKSSTRLSSASQKSYEYYNDTVDVKQNKYAQDFIKHVNDVKRSIYQAELQRTTVPSVMNSYGTIPPPKQMEMKKSINQLLQQHQQANSQHHSQQQQQQLHQHQKQSHQKQQQQQQQIRSMGSPFKHGPPHTLPTTSHHAAQMMKDVIGNRDNKNSGNNIVQPPLSVTQQTTKESMNTIKGLQPTTIEGIGDIKNMKYVDGKWNAQISTSSHRSHEFSKQDKKDSIGRSSSTGGSSHRKQTGAIPKSLSTTTSTATATIPPLTTTTSQTGRSQKNANNSSNDNNKTHKESNQKNSGLEKRSPYTSPRHTHQKASISKDSNRSTDKNSESSLTASMSHSPSPAITAFDTKKLITPSSGKVYDNSQKSSCSSSTTKEEVLFQDNHKSQKVTSPDGKSIQDDTIKDSSRIKTVDHGNETEADNFKMAAADAERGLLQLKEQPKKSTSSSSSSKKSKTKKDGKKEHSDKKKPLKPPPRAPEWSDFDDDDDDVFIDARSELTKDDDEKVNNTRKRYIALPATPKTPENGTPTTTASITLATSTTTATTIPVPTPASATAEVSRLLAAAAGVRGGGGVSEGDREASLTAESANSMKEAKIFSSESMGVTTVAIVDGIPKAKTTTTTTTTTTTIIPTITMTVTPPDNDYAGDETLENMKSAQTSFKSPTTTVNVKEEGSPTTTVVTVNASGDDSKSVNKAFTFTIEPKKAQRESKTSVSASSPDTPTSSSSTLLRKKKKNKQIVESVAVDKQQTLQPNPQQVSNVVVGSAASDVAYDGGDDDDVGEAGAGAGAASTGDHDAERGDLQSMNATDSKAISVIGVSTTPSTGSVAVAVAAPSTAGSSNAGESPGADTKLLLSSSGGTVGGGVGGGSGTTTTTSADEISRQSDAAGVTFNRDQNSHKQSPSSQPPDEFVCIDTSEPTSTDESRLTKGSTRSSNDLSTSNDRIDISDLPLPEIPPKKRRNRLDKNSLLSKSNESKQREKLHNEFLRNRAQQQQQQKYSTTSSRESIESSEEYLRTKFDPRKMHYHSLGHTATATNNSSNKPTYLFGENRISNSKKSGNTDEIFLNKSGWVQVSSKRVNDENSANAYNRKSNSIRHEKQNGDHKNNTIRVIQMDKNNREKPIYAVPRITGSKIEELISRNEARRGSATPKTYMRPGYKIIDPQIASILNERPGFLPVKTFMDIDSPPPITPILSPPPAFQDSKAKYRNDNNVSVQINAGLSKYDPKIPKGMVFSRSFEYDNRKPVDYAETFSKSFDSNLSEQRPKLQHDRSPNFSTLTGCSPNYLTKKENSIRSRDNSPKYQQVGSNFLHAVVPNEIPIYSNPKKLDKYGKSSIDRNGRSRRAQFSRLQPSAGNVNVSGTNNTFRSFDTTSNQRLNSCDSGARSDLSNDEIDDDDEKSSQFLSAGYQSSSSSFNRTQSSANFIPKQRSVTPEKYDSASLRKQRSLTPESRSLTPEDRRKRGSQISLSSRQNSGSRTNTLERKQKYDDKSLSASRSSSSSSYSGREHETTSSHRRSTTRNSKTSDDHRIRRSRSLQLTERSPSRTTPAHKMIVCLGPPSAANNQPIYHSTVRNFPPTIRPNRIVSEQPTTLTNNGRSVRSTDIDKSRSFDLDFGAYNNQNATGRLDFDKSRSFDEDYREQSNKMRFMTDTGLIRDDRLSLKPNMQRNTTIPRQTSPQNYGTRLCDHELTYDMLRRTLDRSPIMDFSREHDTLPPSSRNREKLTFSGNELNFLNERIYDRPIKLCDQSPSDNTYSIDRKKPRDTLTPLTPEAELISMRDAFSGSNEDRLRSNDRVSEYLYRQSQQTNKSQQQQQQQQQQQHQSHRSIVDRGHQPMTGSSASAIGSCTASSCDFWPHCGWTSLKTKPKKNSSVDHPISCSAASIDDPALLGAANSDDDYDDDMQERSVQRLKASAINQCPIYSENKRVSSTVPSRSPRSYRKSQSLNESVRSHNNNMSGVNVADRVKSKPPIYGNAARSISSTVVFLGEREMPITRERDLPTSPISITGSMTSLSKKNIDSVLSDRQISSRETSPSVNDKNLPRLTVSRQKLLMPTRRIIRRQRSQSLPNVFLQMSITSTTSTDDASMRDLFSPNLSLQMRAVSSPSLSENPLDPVNASETCTAGELVNCCDDADSAHQNYVGVLQKFKKTFSQFKGSKQQHNHNHHQPPQQLQQQLQQLQQQQQQQQQLHHYQQVSHQNKIDVLSGGVGGGSTGITEGETSKYRFGPLIWRSSKERRKTKHNRRDKCNSGDSGIQIELEHEEILIQDGLDSIDNSPPLANVRVRRVNSAKASNSMTLGSSAKAKALKKIENYEHKITATPLPIRSLSQPSGLDRMARTDADDSDTDSASSHPDLHDGHRRVIYAEVLFPFTPGGPQELALERGVLVEIIRKDTGPWWLGRIKHDEVISKVIKPQQGWFPKDFVRVIPSSPSPSFRVVDNSESIKRPADNNTLELINCDSRLKNATTILSNNSSVVGTAKAMLSSSPSQQHHQHQHQPQTSETLRNSVIKELLETEINYVKLLSSLCFGYLKELQKRVDIFSSASLNVIFSNIESIWRFQQTFLDVLRKGIENGRIAQVFIEHQSGFMVYSNYCNSYSRALGELETYSSSKDANRVLENCRIAENLPELPLSAHLLAPIQRICRYPLHLSELVKHTPSRQALICNIDGDSMRCNQDTIDCKESLEIALSAMKKVTEMVNEGKRHSENLTRFQTSFENFQGPPIAFHSTRFFMQTDATRVSPNLWNNTYTLFLFDHQLIYCKKDLLKRNHYIYKGRIFLDSCRILNLPDGKLFGVTLKNALRIYCETRNKWFDFCFRSASRKLRFLSTLSAERQFCGTSLFVSELAGEDDGHFSDREYHSDYDTPTNIVERGANAENFNNLNMNLKEYVYEDENNVNSSVKQQQQLESLSNQHKYSDTLPKKSRKVSKDGYEYSTGSLGRRKIGNWFRKAKSTNTTPTQSPTHQTMMIFNSDSSSQSSPALGYKTTKSKNKDQNVITS